MLTSVIQVGAITIDFEKPGLSPSLPIVALSTNPQNSAALAWLPGTTGVLPGAAILWLNNFRRLGTPFASSVGAGTFDAIFLTGILAVLLA